MDAEGIPACKSLYEGAGAKYTTTVDAQNALGNAWGFSVVPNGFLIDEAGVLQWKRIGGMEVRNSKVIEAVEEFLARPAVKPGSKARSQAEILKEIGDRVNSGKGTSQDFLTLGLDSLNKASYQAALKQIDTSISMNAKSAQAHFGRGRALLGLKRKDDAVKSLQSALKLDPKNYLIRKQIWVIRFPDKFHPEIDWAWQRVQMKKELEQEAKDRDKSG